MESARPVLAIEALERLQTGNRRFVKNATRHPGLLGPEERGALVAGQAPFAIILGCSDSRVPAEIVFDQGLGDLFVIRVAGNIVAPSQIGSVEFAAEQFGTSLVVVLGHSHCGAVRATLDQLARPTESRSPHLHAIVERIRPAVEGLAHAEPSAGPDALMDRAVRANVAASARQLVQGSELLKERINRGALLIVGAEYSLEKGEVEFFHGLPETTS